MPTNLFGMSAQPTSQHTAPRKNAQPDIKISAQDDRLSWRHETSSSTIMLELCIDLVADQICSPRSAHNISIQK